MWLGNILDILNQRLVFCLLCPTFFMICFSFFYFLSLICRLPPSFLFQHPVCLIYTLATKFTPVRLLFYSLFSLIFLSSRPVLVRILSFIDATALVKNPATRGIEGLGTRNPTLSIRHWTSRRSLSTHTHTMISSSQIV